MNFSLSLPDWVADEQRKLPSHLPSVEERMEQVIRFSRLNVQNQTGGPFAAGVFERDSGKLVAMGVNRVMAHNCSSAHAEVMALSVAQKALGTYDLGRQGAAHQLVVNWLPCSMCYGATLWSGVRSLAIAGSGPECETITGFDEGPIHPEWERELSKRGIEVINNILTDQAIAGFREFASSKAVVYNARQP